MSVCRYVLKVQQQNINGHSQSIASLLPSLWTATFKNYDLIDFLLPQSLAILLYFFEMLRLFKKKESWIRAPNWRQVSAGFALYRPLLCFPQT